MLGMAILKTHAVGTWIGWLALFVGFVGGWLGLLSPLSGVVEGLSVLGFLRPTGD